MPDYLSHSIFADELLEKGGFSAAPVCKKYDNLFRLGSQGPDILYYCAFLRPGAKLTERANLLHGVSAAQLKDYIDRREGSSERETAYLYGYLAHLALDENVHPFVCETAKGLAKSLGVTEDCAHVILESTAESKELLEKRGIAPQRFDYTNDLPGSAAASREVARINNELLREFGFPTADKTMLAAAVLQLRLLFSLIFDKSGIVRTALDLKYNLTRSDFEARWHIKRPYREAFAAAVFRGGEFDEMARLSENAKTEYLKLAEQPPSPI